MHSRRQVTPGPSLLSTVAVIALTLTATAEVSYKLETVQGRCVIRASTGEVIPWACYSLGADLSIDDWRQKQVELLGSGIRLFQLPLWDTAKQLWANPFTALDEQPLEVPATMSWQAMAPWLLEQQPDARFIMRFSFVPSLAWRELHADEYPTWSDPQSGVQRDGRALVPSLASPLYLATAERTIREVVRWCERQPWRDHIVGYTMFIFGEGATEAGLFDETFDNSAPMTAAFRNFVAERYPDDQALQTAWQDPAATLATVQVPTKADWLAKKQRLQLMHWPAPEQVRREHDYFALQRQLFHRFWDRLLTALAEATAARPVLKGCDNFKQHMLGWMHNGSFTADWPMGALDSYNAIMLASGATAAAPLLDHPGLDMLQTPGMYYSRAMGYAWEAEGLSDAMALRGKVNFMEADMRTWVRKTWRGNPMPDEQQIKDAGTFWTPAEMQTGFDRTLAWALARNQMYYYAAVCGANWWFNAPEILAHIQSRNTIIADSADWGCQETTDAICLVIDDTSQQDEDFSSGFQHLAVERQLEMGLARCGVTYRIHLLADLGRDDFPAYKCFLLPNLFRLDDEVEALLRKRVLRDGNVAIFGPGTGITDGRTLGAARLSRLLGVEMELVPKSTPRRVLLQPHGHQLAVGLPSIEYGDSHAYGPLLVPAAQQLPETGSARPLGTAFYFYFFDRPGLFVNDFGRGSRGHLPAGGRDAADYSVVFSPAVPMPPELLRACARYAGCHVWADENLVVYASGNVVGVHSNRSGQHLLRLPRPARVHDLLTGERSPAALTEIRFAADGPVTRLYRLE